MKTFVKDTFKKDGKVFYAGEEVFFNKVTTDDFLERGLLQLESPEEDEDDTELNLVPEKEEDDKKDDLTEAEINKMTGVQLKELIAVKQLAIDTTHTVAKLKEAVIAILFAEKEEDDTEPEEEENL